MEFKTKKKFQFHAEDSKEYEVVRDYYVSNNQLQGIYFVLLDKESNKLFTRFLSKEYIQNRFEWSKDDGIKGLLNPKYYAIGVEASSRPKVVFEKGTLTITKERNGEFVSEVKKAAQKTTFYIKRDVY